MYSYTQNTRKGLKKHYDEFRNIQRARMLLATEQDEGDDDDGPMDNVSWWCHHDNAPHPPVVHSIMFYNNLLYCDNNGCVYVYY